jgi:hypothetical protein
MPGVNQRQNISYCKQAPNSQLHSKGDLSGQLCTHNEMRHCVSNLHEFSWEIFYLFYTLSIVNDSIIDCSVWLVNKVIVLRNLSSECKDLDHLTPEVS